MGPNLLNLLVAVLLVASSAFAYKRQCDPVYGRPPVHDCIAAASKIPGTLKPVRFTPGEEPGHVQCPFVISSGQCTVRIQCNFMVQTNWKTLQDLAFLLTTGISAFRNEGFHIGCVHELGIGGVATTHDVNDPLWVEVIEKGVPGPEERGFAPLLKGIGGELEVKTFGAPLQDGWYPTVTVHGVYTPTPVQSASAQETEIVDTSTGTSSGGGTETS